jgi:hypothetical protein
MASFSRPPREPDIVVELTLYPTEAGGRKQPLWQGCRLPHDFGLPGEMNDGMYEFLDKPPAPGETAKANVWLLCPERNYGRFEIGFIFRVWENVFFAQGKILEIATHALQKQ